VPKARLMAAAIAVAVTTTLTASPVAVASQRTALALPTLAEVRGARIALADLPAAYQRHRSRDSDDSNASSSTDPECSRRLAELESLDEQAPAAREAEAKFRNDPIAGPFVISSVAVWRSKAPAVQGMAAVRGLLRACDRWTETYPDGTMAIVRLARLSLPKLGSDRLGLRATVTVRQDGFAISARADMALVRIGRAATMLSVGSFGRPDVSLVELSRISTKRLRSIL